MSLYDDLDMESGGTKPVAAGWSSGFKLMQSQLHVQAKKANVQSGNKKGRQSNTLAPVVDLKRSMETDDGLHFNLLTGRLEKMAGPTVASLPFIPNEPVPSLTGVADEYNPLRPNDYEEVVKKKRDQKNKERAAERKNDSKRRHSERDRDRDRDKDKGRDRDQDRRERDRDRDRDRERERDRSNRDDNRENESEMDRSRRRREENEDDYEKPQRASASGAAIAPPPSLVEEEPEPEADRSASPPVNMAASMGISNSVASRIMAKYGYKEGQGLGKKEQGMSTALYVEKTSKRGGKIIHEKDIPKDAPKDLAPNTNLLRNPSKVILLRNMVGPGEVDEDLEPETAEECTKYGKVVKCVIYEMQGAEDEEAVRIFVEFERMESAIKAIVDLNGRFFGGRTVKGGFYNLDKFRRFDLADPTD
ncbi:hypothetical protein SNE40_013387 [Patella caerulea]|uniref:Splicing factor 45 n=1 Tax=Patella caerulea TaxID=87958 RepID=A0AAN8PQP2_PATCE